MNAPGLIDSGYRGEIRCRSSISINGGVQLRKGERIAQLVIIATPTITLHNTYELPELARAGLRKQRPFLEECPL